MASKVGGGEQQRSCKPETSLHFQRYGMARQGLRNKSCADLSFSQVFGYDP
jgi:hypothetical protein